MIPTLNIIDIKDYQLVITGPIGVGKSTVINNLYDILLNQHVKFNIIKEYIDGDLQLGPKMLFDYINGKITNITFQNYILDYYYSEFNKLENKNIVIYERIPDDALLIFANLTNYNNPNDFNITDLSKLFDRCVNCNSKFDIPSFMSSDSKFTEITNINTLNTLSQIVNIINEDFKNHISKRIIGLTTDTKELQNRVNKRERDGESKYSFKYLDKINNSYKKLYKLKSTDYKFRITNIGVIVE